MKYEDIGKDSVERSERTNSHSQHRKRVHQHRPLTNDLRQYTENVPANDDFFLDPVFNEDPGCDRVNGLFALLVVVGIPVLWAVGSWLVMSLTGLISSVGSTIGSVLL